jgi:hypothetical protein
MGQPRGKGRGTEGREEGCADAVHRDAKAVADKIAAKAAAKQAAENGGVDPKAKVGVAAKQAAAAKK